MPERIQLSRKAGWRMPENTLKVDRTTRWGNPFKVGEDVPGMPGEPMDAVDACHYFQIFTVGHWDLTPLRGKNLACWCPIGSPCHGDVLLELANAEAPP